MYNIYIYMYVVIFESFTVLGMGVLTEEVNHGVNTPSLYRPY